MQSILSIFGILSISFSSVLAVYLQSYYPFISFHHPYGPGVVHPPVHSLDSANYYNQNHHGSHGAHGSHGNYGTHGSSQFGHRHGHVTSPLEVITIPIAVLKRLLLAEVKEDKPVVLAFEGKNYTLPYMETMKIMNATLGSGLRMEPQVEPERLVAEVPIPVEIHPSTMAPNITETFGQRLFLSPQEPISSFKNGVEGSA